MSRRTIAILIFIVGILLLSIVGVIFIQQQNQPTGDGDGDVAVDEEGTPIPGPDGTAPPAAEETLPATVEVVVSLQTIPRGFRYPDTLEALEAQGLIAVDMRVAESVRSNVISDPAELLGTYARTDIYQGETITTDSVTEDLALIGLEEFGPSSLIPPGYVAASLPMDRLSGVAYGVAPGDYVDILVTFAFYRIDEQFQTYLENDAAFFVEEFVEAVEAADVEDPETIVSVPTIYTISPFGRFEELPTGDLAHISPSELQRPILVSWLVQNARVIQVGPFVPRDPSEPPTPIPEPVGEGTPTPTPGVQSTPEPPPNVIVVALLPQQQLLMKYADEVGANIDFALRGVNDGQLYSVENVDTNFLLERFNIEIPPNIDYSVDQFPQPPSLYPVTPTPSTGDGAPPPEEQVPE